MKGITRIIKNNILRRPSRSMALILVFGLLSLTIFAGSIISASMSRGFKSLEDRLGADIMVVPYEAVTKSDLKDMILQGNPGYFYMNGEYLDEIGALEGIGRISPQYYLATVKASCCSVPVQITGYDPATDFVITPWIKKSAGGEPGYLDVVVGNDLNAFVGDEMSFFGVKVNVSAKLDKTGTSYDTMVFTTGDTIKTLIEASLNRQLNEYSNINAGNVISCILIDTADGYDVEDVMNDINLHFKKLKAVRTKNMIAGVSDSIAAASDITGTVSVIVCVIALAVMTLACIMMLGERKKEFAVFRAMGASRRMLSQMIMSEGFMISLSGAVLGILTGFVVIFPFSGYIESRLSLPFLLPEVGTVMSTAIVSVILCVTVGTSATGIMAARVSRADTGEMLRSGE